MNWKIQKIGKTFFYCPDKLTLNTFKPSYSKDALFLGELSWVECPEVDMGFPTGDDIGAVTGVKLHSEHSLVGTLKTQQHTQTPVTTR